MQFVHICLNKKRIFVVRMFFLCVECVLRAHISANLCYVCASPGFPLLFVCLLFYSSSSIYTIPYPVGSLSVQSPHVSSVCLLTAKYILFVFHLASSFKTCTCISFVFVSHLN